LFDEFYGGLVEVARVRENGQVPWNQQADELPAVVSNHESKVIMSWVEHSCTMAEEREKARSSDKDDSEFSVGLIDFLRETL
jgi:hypothetical protein